MTAQDPAFWYCMLGDEVSFELNAKKKQRMEHNDNVSDDISYFSTHTFNYFSQGGFSHD